MTGSGPRVTGGEPINRAEPGDTAASRHAASDHGIFPVNFIFKTLLSASHSRLDQLGEIVSLFYDYESRPYGCSSLKPNLSRRN